MFSSYSAQQTTEALKDLDPRRQHIRSVLGRANCIFRGHDDCIKDLRILQDRDLANVVIIDSRPFAFQGQMTNAIYVPPFTGAEDDRELLPVLEFLLTIKDVPDVRPIVKKFAGVMRLYSMYLTCALADPCQDDPRPRTVSELGFAKADDISIPQEFE